MKKNKLWMVLGVFTMLCALVLGIGAAMITYEKVGTGTITELEIMQSFVLSIGAMIGSYSAAAFFAKYTGIE